MLKLLQTFASVQPQMFEQSANTDDVAGRGLSLRRRQLRPAGVESMT